MAVLLISYKKYKGAVRKTAPFSLSKKSPERVAFLSQIWYNEKGDKNAAKG